MCAQCDIEDTALDAESLRYFGVAGGDAASISRKVQAVSVSDPQIEEEIARNFAEFGIATCPHTATATYVWRHLEQDLRETRDWILVATAHAAKFEQIVEPIIGEMVAVPDELASILERERQFTVIDADLGALANALDRGFRD